MDTPQNNPAIDQAREITHSGNPITDNLRRPDDQPYLYSLEVSANVKSLVYSAPEDFRPTY